MKKPWKEYYAITKEIKQCAITPNECIAIAVERSWTGFKVEWVDNLYNNKRAFYL